MRSILFALLIAFGVVAQAQAAQQLTCVEEKSALDGMQNSNPELVIEIENRYDGPNALAIVLSHNANSALQLDPNLGWYVLVMKITHKKTGAEYPLRAVLIGKGGEICRQGMLPRPLIDRLLATVPGV